MSVSWMPVSDIGGAATSPDAAVGTAKSQDDPIASKDVFMQLLVAQIKNQNPMSPQDGIQFLSQLVQFSEVEQLTAMRQDMAAVRGALVPATPAATTAKTGN
jgi:flagellar basal-body rod modification protein FlgD